VLVGLGVTRTSDPTTKRASAALARLYEAVKAATLVPRATISPTMMTPPVAAQERQVREDPLDQPRQQQQPRDPDADRDDHQVHPQRHGPAVVDRAGDALEGAGAQRGPLDDGHHQ
jgi:hypothetical protein